MKKPAYKAPRNYWNLQGHEMNEPATSFLQHKLTSRLENVTAYVDFTDDLQNLPPNL